MKKIWEHNSRPLLNLAGLTRKEYNFPHFHISITSVYPASKKKVFLRSLRSAQFWEVWEVLWEVLTRWVSCKRVGMAFITDDHLLSFQVVIFLNRANFLNNQWIFLSSDPSTFKSTSFEWVTNSFLIRLLPGI